MLVTLLVVTAIVNILVQSLGYMPVFDLHDITLKYYKEVLARADVRQSILVSLHVSLWSSVIAALFGTLICAALVLVLLLGLAAVGADRWLASRVAQGRTQVAVDYDNVVIALPEDNKTVAASDNGKTIKYDGHTYRLNENLSSLLFMGIDRRELDEAKTYGNNGQADVLLLMVIDRETGDSKMVNISRDSYAEIMLYSGSGTEAGYAMRQICLAYAYGDGRELSCENTVEAVSKLFYGMPIEKYVALDLEGVLVANEAVGGITLTSLNDINMPDGSYVSEGDEITLHGENCERYIRARGDEIDANEGRMARQKQYLNAFFTKLMRQARSDFGVISALYQAITPYMVSNLDLNEALYLAQFCLDNRVSFDIRSIAGEYDWLEHNGVRNSVFYLDGDSLFETVLSVYYTQID